MRSPVFYILYGREQGVRSKDMEKNNYPAVVLLDSGIDAAHPDLSKTVKRFVDFVHGRQEPYDDFGHGTHIAGIIAGNGEMSEGKYRGYAPGCPLVILKILDEHGQGSRQTIKKALYWVEENRETYGLRILNFSLGTENTNSRNQEEVLAMVDRMVELGLIVIAAAGNMGPWRGSVTAPGSSKKVITVGASDMLSKTRIYSGRGPTAECICKPDIVFPGKNIVSCAASVEQSGWYCRKSGTSMSSAAVSGLTARLLSQYPAMTHREIKWYMHSCCRDLYLDRNIQGWGCLEPQLYLNKNPFL